ncbi:MAG: hypothetical protein OEW52_00250 [Thermoleophilia bacterium]|nr:hypothetical protein [Thermoleophilia bacterium]
MAIANGTEQVLTEIADGVLLLAGVEVDDLHRARLYKLAGLLLELAAEEALEGSIEPGSATLSRVAEELQEAYACGPVGVELWERFETWVGEVPARAEALWGL